MRLLLGALALGVGVAVLAGCGGSSSNPTFERGKTLAEHAGNAAGVAYDGTTCFWAKRPVFVCNLTRKGLRVPIYGCIFSADALGRFDPKTDCAALAARKRP